MTFCTACGAPLEAGKKFCTACGKAVTLPAAPAAFAGPAAAAAAAPAPVAQAPAQGGGSALKIILIVLGIIFFFVFLAIGGVVYLGYRAKKAIESAAITSTTSGGKTTVNTPWGKVESEENADPQQVLESIGAEPYPGATVVEGSIHTATLGTLKTATLKFSTPDPPSKVFDFYKGLHRNAMAASSGDKYTVMFTGKDKALVTVTAQPGDGGTEIDVGSMTGAKGAPAAGDDSN